MELFCPKCLRVYFMDRFTLKILGKNGYWAFCPDGTLLR